MVFFNWATMQMAAKIVYYGPGLCGKTSNLSYIYAKTSPNSRGEMVSLETESDRTLFFDLLPIEVGTIGGFKTRLQLYTVPGQVFYNTTRKLVLKGVDGLVFVADSQRPMREANIESFRSLTENIEELGLEMSDLPLVLQYNKRDLQNILTEEELDADLNPMGEFVSHTASAINGEGVFETLKEITKLTLRKLRRRMASPQTETTSRPSPMESKPEPAAAAQPTPRRAISAASLARAAEEGVVGDSVDAPAVPAEIPTEQPSAALSVDDSMRDAPSEAASGVSDPVTDDEAPIADVTHGEAHESAAEAGSDVSDASDHVLIDQDETTPAHGTVIPDDDDAQTGEEFDPDSEDEALPEEIEYIELDETDIVSFDNGDGDTDAPSPEETTAPSMPELEPETTSEFGFEEPKIEEAPEEPEALDGEPALDSDDDAIEFDTSADKELEIAPPPMKRVQISDQTNILAELDGLRREATEAPASRGRHVSKAAELDLDALLGGGPSKKRNLKRRIEQSLNSNIFSRMRTVQLAFEIQDGDGATIQTLEPISLPLDDVAALEKLVLQLTVDLENVK